MGSEEQDRIVVVLVRARNPSNIGAVARGMHDLGYSQLRIVNEFPVPFAAAKSAVDASSVLDAAAEFPHVAEAVSDCTLVLGTTAVGERALEHPLYLIANASNLVRKTLASNAGAKVALLFGSEKTGLSNDELSHCHALVTIPMNARGVGKHLSMNLGQAVAVCLYAIGQSEVSRVPSPIEALPTEAASSAEDQERLTNLLREALEVSGYTRRNPANARETSVRRLVRRMGLSATDAAVWTGVLRQILYSLTHKSDARGQDDSSKMEARAEHSERKP